MGHHGGLWALQCLRPVQGWDRLHHLDATGRVCPGRQSGWTPPLGGSLQGVVEAVPALVAFEDAQTIYGGGFNLLLRYDVATGTRVVPFLEGGAGDPACRRPNRPTGDPSSRPRSSTSPCRSAPAYAIFSPHRRPSASPTAFITFQMPTPPRIIPGLNADFILLGFSIFR